MQDNLLTTRFTQIESSLTYLQHECSQMNQVLLEQQKMLNDLQSQLKSLLQKIDHRPTDLPDPLEDTPPHY